MEHNLLQTMIQHAPTGMAVFRYRKHAGSIDFEQELSNHYFAAIWALEKKGIQGKTIAELFPEMWEAGSSWPDRFLRVAEEGGDLYFEYFSVQRKCWYSAHLYSPQSGYLAMVMDDISKKKTDEASLEKLVVISEEFLQMNAQQIGYQNITDIFKDISGAFFVAFNLYDADGENFTTVATSGLERYLNKISSLLGFSLVGKRWKHDPIRAGKTKNKMLNRFDSLLDLTGGTIPDFVIARGQQLFSIGDTLLLKIMKDDLTIGDFTFFMPRGIAFRHEKICSIFSRQLGLLLTRKRAEEQLLEQSRLLHYNLTQQRILSEITLALNSLEDFDHRMNSSLKKIGEHVDVSRVYIFENNEENTHTSNTYEWCNQGVHPQITNLQDIPYVAIPLWEKKLKEEGLVHAEDLAALDEGTRKMLEGQDVNSVLVLALTVNNRFFGFVGFDECVRKKHWTDGELDMLRIVSAIISHAYERRNMELTIKQERDKANRANQSKSEFLANMSHEIRTPMNAILGFSEALYYKLHDQENKKMVESILSAGKLLLSLLNDILDLAKIEAGKLDLRPQPVNLPLILDETCALYSEKARRKGVGLTLDVSKDFPDSLVLDETRIQQILFNLASNAVKFTHKGYVRVSATFHPQSDWNGTLAISVKDTGIGIAPDQVPIIFEDFSQLNPSSTRKYEGAGLGLSICKKLTEMMQGEIWVESILGEGSVFHVKLPNVAIGESSAQARQAISPQASIQFERAVVMVVDDTLVDIEMVESLLTSLGLKVVHTTDGSHAMELMHHYKPSLLLLDTRMPGMNGYELLQAINKDAATSHIPVVAYSATIPAYGSNPLSRLFSGYLQKPVSRQVLINELIKHLPHTIAEEVATTDDYQTVAMEELTGETAAGLPLVVDELRNTFLPQWQTIKGQLVIFKIEAFSSQLEALATKHHFDYLLQYAQKLSADAGMLDIEAMKQTLDRFPKVCEQIEAIANTSSE